MNDNSDLTAGAQTLAVATRGPMVESAHAGHLVTTDPAGSVQFSWGDPGTVIYARSSLKPLQGVAMVRNGLQLPPDLLALACASHSGEPMHLEGVSRILTHAGLTQEDLDNTPDFPYDPAVEITWRAAGGERTRLVQNCSGKHSAMLATCVVNGWPTKGYLAPSHPLQQSIRATVAELTGDEAAAVTVDGCGAPLFSCTLSGLAGAFSKIAARHGAAEEAVAQAMSAHPELVGGTGRDATALMAGVPGLVAKDGAEGVYAVGLPDGRGIALKILDGSARARPVVITAALRHLGVDAPVLRDLEQVPILGHGHPVGSLVATLGGE